MRTCVNITNINKTTTTPTKYREKYAICPYLGFNASVTIPKQHQHKNKSVYLLLFCEQVKTSVKSEIPKKAGEVLARKSTDIAATSIFFFKKCVKMIFWAWQKIPIAILPYSHTSNQTKKTPAWDKVKPTHTNTIATLTN